MASCHVSSIFEVQTKVPFACDAATCSQSHLPNKNHDSYSRSYLFAREPPYYICRSHWVFGLRAHALNNPCILPMGEHGSINSPKSLCSSVKLSLTPSSLQ